MVQTNPYRTAKDCTQDCRRLFEALADIRYLIDRDLPVVDLRRLLRTEGQELESLIQRVREELDAV